MAVRRKVRQEEVRGEGLQAYAQRWGATTHLERRESQPRAGTRNVVAETPRRTFQTNRRIGARRAEHEYLSWKRIGLVGDERLGQRQQLVAEHRYLAGAQFAPRLARMARRPVRVPRIRSLPERRPRSALMIARTKSPMTDQ